MADSEQFSDAQLVNELRQFGEQIQLPLKQNRRHILLKKLNHYRARSRQNLQDNLPQKTKAKSNASKLAVSPASKSNPSKSSYQPVDPQDEDRFSLRSSIDPGSRPYSRYGRRPPLNLDALSSDDSETEPIASVEVSLSTSTSNTNRSRTPSSSSPKVRERKREPQFADNVLRTLRRRTEELPPRRTRRRDSAGLGSDISSRSIDDSINNETNYDDIAVPSPARSSLYPDISRLTSFWSRSKEGDKSNAFESSDSDNDEKNASTYEVENKSVNTSFLPVGQSIPSTSFNVTPDSSFGSPNVSPGFLGYRMRQRRFTNGHPRVQQYKSWYLESLPHLLVVLTAVFFLGITATYIGTHKDFFLSWFSSSSNIGSGDRILVCQDGRVSEDCYERGEVDKAIGYIEELFKYLSIMKGRVLCDEIKAGEDVTRISVFRNDVYSQAIADSANSERLIDCCLNHILANPHWNIRALKADGSMATEVKDVYLLESSIADMSFWCRFRRSLTHILYVFALVVVFIVCVFLASLYLKHKLKQKEAEQREVFTMVERIIETLQEHHEQTKADDSDEPPYLVVQHVRDQFLPPSKRRKLQPIWNKAVEFIAANESRIRLETKLVSGEEFEVWHWLPPTIHNGKIWQGQAFGENNNNSNQVIYSPTPCLKIRNMFDNNLESEDDWEESVTDAILEKCRHIGNILHIYVDTDSREGCVYLKCTDCQTAGKVRLALHGWWFDGRLVTVRHLKVDHYHKRWPEARNATRPCQPSSNQMRSLSQPFYKSSLEMT